MSLSAIPKGLRVQVFERDFGRCQYCRLSQFGQAAVFHINHVIPKSRGGLTDLANLVLQCPHCSLHKSDKIISVNRGTGEEVSLFHPLKQIWREHFTLDADGYCHGTTSIGDATVEALRMNDPLPRIARAVQIGLGLLLP